ncbi:hypothetical protein J4429_01915 [Candidatus Pacearchaeota archaeon]|nr:hypothetical protein [Candidatus Pacearchaeota archaeon]
MKEEEKSRFLRVYQNLPLNERRNTILVLEEKGKSPDKKPVSWDIAYIEISEETKIGETILNKLIKLNLI